jgi:chromosome segregation ATPase
MSQCEGLKEEGVADCEEVCQLRDEFRGLKAKADHHKVELRQAQESLEAVTIEQDEASLHADSLSKSLEDEQSEDRALNARIEGISSKYHFTFWVQPFFLAMA